MKRELRIGGIAAFVQALCYVFGFVMLAVWMNPGSTEAWTQVEELEFILDRELLFTTWIITIYVVFGIALVVLAVVLHRVLQSASPLLMAIASPFGLIWAGLVIASGMVAIVGLESVSAAYGNGAEAAAQTWAVIGIVQDGIGGGVEVVGGIWVLCVSIAALRSQKILPKPLNLLGLLVGVAGILTVVPGLTTLGAVFGIAQIIWFLGVGFVLFRTVDVRKSAAADA